MYIKVKELYEALARVLEQREQVSISVVVERSKKDEENDCS